MLRKEPLARIEEEMAMREATREREIMEKRFHKFIRLYT
jgi:hypothetical protein